MGSHFPTHIQYNKLDVPRNVLFGNKWHIDLNSGGHLGVWALCSDLLLTKGMFQFPSHGAQKPKYCVYGSDYRFCLGLLLTNIWKTGEIMRMYLNSLNSLTICTVTTLLMLLMRITVGFFFAVLSCCTSTKGYVYLFMINPHWGTLSFIWYLECL